MIYDYGVYDESDDFFTLTTVPQPTITVTSPNGGETWGIGTTQTITWSSENDPGELEIWLYKDGMDYDTIENNTDDDGEYIWNISSGFEEGSDYKVRIRSVSNENVYDESDSNFTLSVSTQTGNYSLSFDGEDDLISFQNAVIPMTGDVSVQVWAYAEENNGYSNMVTQGDPTVGAYFISYESDDQMRISHEWSDINVTYPFGVWVQITVVKNDDGTKLYFDGQLVAETNSTMLPTENPFFIGVQYNGNTEHWNGNIDEVRIWNIALTETEIQSNYNIELSGDESGLIGYWNFNAGEGDILYDHSGNANHGTIYGATWIDDVPSNGTITVTSPNGGETWDLGSTHDITWTSSDLSGNVKIDLYQSGSLYQTIVDSTDDDGSYGWTIPDGYDEGDNYKVRVSSVSVGSVYDESDGDFSLSASTQTANYSLSFDGVDDYVSTGPWFSGINNEYTLMSYFRFNQLPDENNEYLLLHKGHFQDKGIFVGIPYDGTADTSIVGFDRDPGSWINVIYNDFVVNHWYNVAFTANDDSLKLYVDGVFVEGVVRTFGNTDWSTSYQWSSFGGGAGYGGYANVNMDDVSIWDTELSVSEIQSYMATSPTGNESALVSYWDFNEGTGTTAYDATSNGNDGTIYGATWSDDVPSGDIISGCTDPYAESYNPDATMDDGSCAGYPDNGEYSLSFDGSDDYVDCGNDDNFDFATGDFTVEAWINPTSASQNGRIVARGDTGTPGSYQLNISTNGRLRISFYENELNSSNDVIIANTWQHLVLTRNGTTVKGYVNAEEIISFSNSSNLTSSQALVIGYEPGSSSYFNGLIDEVAIWNDALTSSEVNALYNSGNGLDASSNSGNYTSSSNLQGFWKFNAGSGEILYDHTGNANHGTINGATWNTDVPFGDTDPTITVTSPDGGETWDLGSTHNITWSSSMRSEFVKIDLYQGGSAYQTITSNTLGDYGYYSWTIPSNYDVGSEYKVKITFVSDSSKWGESDGYFTLTAVPTIIVTSPNGGEDWELGSTQDITWTSSDLSGDVKIELYKSGSIEETLSADESNDGSYSWAVSSSLNAGTDYRVRISSISDVGVYDESDADFELSAAPTITVTSPNGGESWAPGSSYTITWNSSNLSGYFVDIKLIRSYVEGNDSSVTTKPLTDNTINDGSYAWTISSSQTESDLYRIKIEESGNPSVYDYSDYYFTIEAAPTITVTSPNGGEDWELGSTQDITWTSSDLSGNVKIELYKSGSIGETLSADESNDGSYSWSVSSSLAAGTDYRVRISSVSDANVYDESDADFALSSGEESEPGFSAVITVSGEGVDYDMTFGFHPDATDGYDEGIDSYAPPAPPPPVFDAALSWDGERYYIQILAWDGDLSEHVYDIALAYGSDNLITLTWDNTGWSDLGTFVLQDAFDGLLGIDIDMTTVDSLTLTNPAFTILKLKVTPNP